VRHLRVGDFTDAELEPLTTGDTALARFFANSSATVQRLLRNPFNLRLAAELLDPAVTTPPEVIQSRGCELDLAGEPTPPQGWCRHETWPQKGNR
jgi:hypothetical protein